MLPIWRRCCSMQPVSRLSKHKNLLPLSPTRSDFLLSTGFRGSRAPAFLQQDRHSSTGSGDGAQEDAHADLSTPPKPIVLVMAALSNGTRFDTVIKATPKADLTKLEEGLRSILPPIDMNHTRRLNLWSLDPEGDAIHLARRMPSKEEAEKVKSLIMAIADEMNHHPHISIQSDSTLCQILLITCTTHKPPGLGSRDVLLATRVSQVIQAWSKEYFTSENNVYEAEKQKLLQQHRDEIDRATGKKK